MTPRRFRIAFSFAGEKRDFVAKVAAILANQFSEKEILSDKYHKLKDDELIAFNNQVLARALFRQGRRAEAIAHADAALSICIRIRLINLPLAQAMLKECQP